MFTGKNKFAIVRALVVLMLLMTLLLASNVPVAADTCVRYYLAPHPVGSSFGCVVVNTFSYPYGCDVRVYALTRDGVWHWVEDVYVQPGTQVNFCYYGRCAPGQGVTLMKAVIYNTPCCGCVTSWATWGLLCR